MAKTTLTRRQFIGGAAGLQLSLYLSGAERGLFRLLTGAEGMAPETVLAQGEAGFGLGAFIQIDAEGWVTILAPKPDIGQGTRTRVIGRERGTDLGGDRHVAHGGLGAGGHLRRVEHHRQRVARAGGDRRPKPVGPGRRPALVPCDAEPSLRLRRRGA